MPSHAMGDWPRPGGVSDVAQAESRSPAEPGPAEDEPSTLNG